MSTTLTIGMPAGSLANVQRGGNLVCPLSELQAVVLLPQLERLNERNALRRQNVAWLLDHLAERDARIEKLEARLRRRGWMFSLPRAQSVDS